MKRVTPARPAGTGEVNVIRFPPEFAEWLPAIAGLIVMAITWGLILHTRHTRRSDRLRYGDRCPN